MEIIPFEYHKTLRDYLKSQTKVWDWFKNLKHDDTQYEKLKDQLLQNTYRFPEDDELYKIADKILQQIGLTKKIFFYQAQDQMAMNASVAIVEDEIHIVFSGSILKLLTEQEKQSVVAHEIAHVALYSIEDKEYDVAERIITSIANDYRTEQVYVTTAQNYHLYTELLCDRISFEILQDIEPVVAGLVKIMTGLEKISVSSYIKQAEEIFEKEKISTKGISHPELFIRARALKLHVEKPEGYESEIKKMIEGKIEVDKLDLFSQKSLHSITQKVVTLVVQPEAIRSDLVMALAKQYYPELEISKGLSDLDDIAKEISDLNESTKDYLSYVLIDFTKVDYDLEGLPMQHVYTIASKINLKDSFEKTYKKEFKISDKAFEDILKSSNK